MKIGTLGKAVGMLGVCIAVFSGTMIVHDAMFGPNSWLLLPFATGILLVAWGPVLALRQRVEDLRRRLPGSEDGGPTPANGTTR